MSRMLQFFDGLLKKARHLEQLGQYRQASHLYVRLADMRQLPDSVACDAQAGLGRVRLEQGRHARARRHLAAALVHEPDSAAYHFLLASALVEDTKADQQRATPHFRRALELDDKNPEYLLAFARHCFRMEEREEAIALVRRAIQVAGDNLRILAEAAEQLRRHGEYEEARSQLRVALFRHAGDRRFEDLWKTHQFQALHADQQEAREQASDDPTILPFSAPAESTGPRLHGRRILRKDAAEDRKAPYRANFRRLPR